MSQIFRRGEHLARLYDLALSHLGPHPRFGDKLLTTMSRNIVNMYILILIIKVYYILGQNAYILSGLSPKNWTAVFLMRCRVEAVQPAWPTVGHVSYNVDPAQRFLS